jgi:hypothetical protein
MRLFASPCKPSRRRRRRQGAVLEGHDGLPRGGSIGSDRPALQRLLADVRGGNVDVIAVTKIDRFSRSLNDFFQMWEELVRNMFADYLRIGSPSGPVRGCFGFGRTTVLHKGVPDDLEVVAVQGGYVDGANEPQPSVIAFNTTVAGPGVIELLRVVTGFAAPTRRHCALPSRSAS